MGKDLKGKELGKGLSQRKDGRYEARAMVNGKLLDICDKNLAKLKKRFETEKASLLRDEKNVREGVTLEEWYNEWFEKCKAPNLKDEVCAKIYYRKIKNTYLRLIGDKKLKYLSQINIQDATNQLSAEGYVERTIAEALCSIKECLAVAIANKIIISNPSVGVTINDAREMQEKRILEHWEQDLFIEVIESNFYYEPLMILLLTGMRIGELSGLQWNDIDFVQKEIHISRALKTVYIDGVKYEELGLPKTTNSIRTIPFFGNIESLFRSWRDKQSLYRKQKGSRWRLDTEKYGDLVFTNTYGSPITRYNIGNHIDNAVTQMRAIEDRIAKAEHRPPREIKSIHPHAFRHTFATRCFENSMDILFVQRVMGHASYETTASYTHILSAKKELEAAKGYDLLGQAKNRLEFFEANKDLRQAI